VLAPSPSIRATPCVRVSPSPSARETSCVCMLRAHPQDISQKIFLGGLRVFVANKK
jgi:hypothetical protein